jgi:hypothetical protein
LGNSSCGHKALEQYEVKTETVDFGFSILPFQNKMGEIQKIARQQQPF